VRRTRCGRRHSRALLGMVSPSQEDPRCEWPKNHVLLLMCQTVQVLMALDRRQRCFQQEEEDTNGILPPTATRSTALHCNILRGSAGEGCSKNGTAAGHLLGDGKSGLLGVRGREGCQEGWVSPRGCVYLKHGGHGSRVPVGNPGYSGGRARLRSIRYE
jgi:hypothetical protein